jgi:aminopeptidase-like protein
LKLYKYANNQLTFCDRFAEGNKVYEFKDVIPYKKDYEKLKKAFCIKHNKVVVDVDDAQFKRKDLVLTTHIVDNKTLEITETSLYQRLPNVNKR